MLKQERTGSGSRPVLRGCYWLPLVARLEAAFVAGLAGVRAEGALLGTLAERAAATVSGGPLAVALAEFALEAAVALEVPAAAGVAATVSLVGAAVPGRLTAVVELEVDQLAADPGAGQCLELIGAQVRRELHEGVVRADVDAADLGRGDAAFVGDGANDGTRHDALAASDGDPVGGVALGQGAGRAA